MCLSPRASWHVTRLSLRDQLQDEERRRKQQLEEIRKREAEERAKQEEERRWREEERSRREAEEKVSLQQLNREDDVCGRIKVII